MDADSASKAATNLAEKGLRNSEKGARDAEKMKEQALEADLWLMKEKLAMQKINAFKKLAEQAGQS